MATKKEVQVVVSGIDNLAKAISDLNRQLGKELLPVFEKVSSLYMEDNVNPIRLNVSFDYSKDAGFSVSDPDAPVRLFDVKDVKAFGKDSATQSFKNIFKIWGKAVVGIDLKQSGGYCFLDKLWMKAEQEGITTAPPSNILGYAPFVGKYQMFKEITVNFHGFFDNLPVYLVSFVVMNIRYAAIVAHKDVARECLPHNDISMTVSGVSLPFPWNTLSGEILLGESVAEVTFRLAVPDDMRIIAYGCDDKATNTFVHIESADNHGMYDRDLYKNLAGIVNNMVASEELVLKVATEAFAPTPTQVIAKLVNRSGAKHVTPDPKEPQFKLEPLFKLDGFGELPDAPYGYVWIADSKGLLYLCSKDGRKLVMPYDVLDLTGMIASNRSEEVDVRKRQNALDIQAYQRLYDHQVRLLEGLLYTYRTFRGRDVVVPDEGID